MRQKPKTAVLHYSAPPVVGGVEAVIWAHTRAFVQEGYPVKVIAGRGDEHQLPAGVELISVPEIDSQHPEIADMTATLESGKVPDGFGVMVKRIRAVLAPVLSQVDNLIVHNILTKHFNLPLTAALFQLLDEKAIPHCIGWCHDFTWTSPSSRSKVRPGYPWDLLCTYRPDVTYVVVSRRRQATLADLLDCARDEIKVIYNGVDPKVLLGLTDEGAALIDRLDLMDNDLVLLMPVRVTEAKNIEYALRVVAALKEMNPRVSLVLTGPPDPHDGASMNYFRSLQARRSELGVEQEMRFVFESGPQDREGYTVAADVVGDLFRICDLVFVPSHREGFGMPVLEAGLAGIPVVCTDVPAAEEIAGPDVTRFDASQDPAELADEILSLLEEDPVHRLRRRVRQRYTWRAIFRREIRPLLVNSE
jgi:glycosyltransferase involved in cell wall biosynthesis